MPETVLIALERRLDRLEQRFEARLALLMRLGEALVGALYHGLLRFGEQLARRVAELDRKLFARFIERLDLGLETLGSRRRIRTQRGKIALGCIPRRAHRGQLFPQRVRLPCPLHRDGEIAQCRVAHLFQRDDLARPDPCAEASTGAAMRVRRNQPIARPAKAAIATAMSASDDILDLRVM